MKDNLGSLPDDIKPLVSRLVDTVRNSLDDKEFIQPVWFMVDRRGERAMPIMAPFEDEKGKRKCIELVRHLVLAQQPEVDAVIFICEGWRKTETRGEPGYDDRKTPVRDRIGALDVIMIMVETYDGIWVADPVVTGEPGFDRKLEDIEFHYMSALEGNLASYLPPRSKLDIN